MISYQRWYRSASDISEGISISYAAEGLTGAGTLEIIVAIDVIDQ